jgi:phosphoribosylglycinamide formyltransferase-1
VRVGVLVSGSGTILDAMLDDGVPVHLVLADRVCGALDVARRHRVHAELLDRRNWGGYGREFDRRAFSTAVTDQLRAVQIDVVAMAGFGTILDDPIHRAFPGRILNTHPALLPAFPGWHGVEDALEAGVAVTGCTVHVATLEMDAGPILAQEQVAVLPGDTAESLHERIKAVERRLYPATIKRVLVELAAGRPPESLTRSQAAPA